MPAKKDKRSLFSKLVEEAKPHMLGKVLCIDPSSGSASSKPGFAYFENCVLKEIGDINVQGGRPLWIRLQELGVALRKYWPDVDVLITENIPPFMAKGKEAQWRNVAVVNLHKSIGTILGSVQATAFIEITPGSWHRFQETQKGMDWYEKSDAMDALMMGLSAFHEAGIKVDYSAAFDKE